MDSGECAGLSGAWQVCGYGKHQPETCHHSLHIKHIQQAVKSPTRAENETVISPNDFKLWDQLEMVPCVACRQRKDGEVWFKVNFFFFFFFLSFSHLVAKLQLIRCQHDDVVIDGEHSFCLDLVVREEAVAQLVLFGSHDFEGNAYLRPKRLCQEENKTFQ